MSTTPSRNGRMNPDLVYPEGSYFLRRDPDNHKLWLVVTGKFNEDKTFAQDRVIRSGLETGKEARLICKELTAADKVAQTA